MSIYRIIDFETTGINAEAAEVLEVGTIDLDTETMQLVNPMTYLCGVDEISPGSRAIHHIWPQDVANLPKFDPQVEIERAKRDGVTAFFAHNVEFEQQWLDGDVPFHCTYKASLRVFDFAPGHKNFELFYWLQDHGLIEAAREEISFGHRAGPDAIATGHILRLLVDQGVTLDQFAQWTTEPRVLPTCPIGKEWRGSPWSEVDDGFLRWMLNQDSMEPDLKWNAEHELNRRGATQDAVMA